MVNVPDEAAKTLLDSLLLLCPAWEEGLEEGNPVEQRFKTVHPKLQIPSAHPAISNPLIVTLGGTLELYWHGGYFYDFVGPTRADDAYKFLEKFFAEQVLCLTQWRNGKKVAGGPFEEGDDALLEGDYDRIELRSWRGNRDRTIER